MLASAQDQSPAQDAGVTAWSIRHPTGGQQIAAHDVHTALSQRQPLILLFGEQGSGKTTLIDSVLASPQAEAFRILRFSATSGEFTSVPSFDDLLEMMCRRLGVAKSKKQRPEALAILSAILGDPDKGGQPLLLALDQADHLTDDVIADVARLPQYLDVTPDRLLRLFVGSMTLASRIDVVLRRLGSDERVWELRLSSPSADEMAALLAYSDSAQPGGPMLRPDAIERINAYAKSNLHWAVPMADAARALAESEGKREVTADLVRSALLDIWSPEAIAAEFDTELESPTPGGSDGAQAPAGFADSVDRSPDLITAERSTFAHERRSAERLAPAAAILAFLLGTIVLAAYDMHTDVALRQQQPVTAGAQPEAPAPPLDTGAGAPVEVRPGAPTQRLPDPSAADGQEGTVGDAGAPPAAGQGSDATTAAPTTAEPAAAAPTTEQYGPWPLQATAPGDASGVAPASSDAASPDGTVEQKLGEQTPGKTKPATKRRAKTAKTPVQRPDDLTSDKWIQTR